MAFFGSKKRSIQSDYFKLMEEVPNLPSGNMYEVALYDDYLEISAPIGSIKLKYSQIQDVYYGLQTEIVEKDRSSIGRAVAGGLLFGGVGAVVGSVSAVGRKKEKTERKFVFVINYLSSSGEDNYLAFEDTRMWHGRKVADKLKSLCGISDSVEAIEPKQEYL